MVPAMARPLKAGRKTVDLASGEVRVSKIRRDPPPQKLKAISIEERSERDQRNAIVGITVITVALMVILYAVSVWAGWTPRTYIVQL